MSWKSALVGSALVLGAQTTFANKPLPCPTTGPVQDTIWLVQWDTRQRIEDRLRAIDIEKRHQVVVVTVRSVEEYGFGSIEEMANKIGMWCGVGYRWENTGVVVLYTQVPSRYRIENANTERYIVDPDSKRIIAHSKSDGVCKKEDVACRLDDITWGIDTLIRREFPDKQAVAQIDSTIKTHDEAESSRKMNELLWSLSIGAVVIVVLGWGTFWVTKWVGAINRRNRRKELKREILELFTRLHTEKQKYPNWFQDSYIRRTEEVMTEIQQYNDEQLDRILESDGLKRDYERNIRSVREAIDGWQAEFSTIQSRLQEGTQQLTSEKEQVSQKNTRLLSEWFIFPSVQIPSIDMGDNPADSLKRIERGLWLLSEARASLEEIPRYYASVRGSDSRLQSGFITLESEYKTLTAQYQEIFGKVPTVDITTIAQGVAELVKRFQEAYSKKDISSIKSIVARGASILGPIHEENRTLKQSITWYTAIPEQIARREKQLAAIKPNQKYISDANAYAQKTGKRSFLNYDLGDTLARLRGILGMIRNHHSQKQNLDTLDGEFRVFDKEYSSMQEYMGLGSALAAILAAEIAEELRRKKEAERRKREEEEEERRRRRREEEEEAARRRRDDDSRSSSSSSSSSSNDWSSGGGWGFSGGGATDD